MIKEAYYNKNNQIYAISADEIAPYGESVEELKGDLKLMMRAFKKPVLVERDLIFNEPDN